MKCSIWLNRKKIDSAALIPDNLDIASLRGYFLGGSLMEWLEEHNGEEYARLLKEVSPDDTQLNGKLAAVFGGNAISGKPLDGGGQREKIAALPEELPQDNSSVMDSAAENSFAEWSGSDVSAISEVFGSYLSGSFSEWEWEWLWNYYKGFSSGSFVTGSFYESSYLLNMFEKYYGGSFVQTSFGSFSSFSHWERLSYMLAKLLNSKCGSFSENNFMEPDEYDYIMLKTLLLCPLDRFGYGIHIL